MVEAPPAARARGEAGGRKADRGALGGIAEGRFPDVFEQEGAIDAEGSPGTRAGGG